MRTIRPTVMLTAALLVFAAPGCDHTPTAVHDDDAGSALFSSSAQSRVDLCHRNGAGDYVKITVADAAYSTHMAHGDRNVGGGGECPLAGTSRFELEFANLNYAWFLPEVEVVLYAPGELESSLAVCHPPEIPVGLYSCGTYDVPTGSTIALLSSHYVYTWNHVDCTGSNSCVMNGDRSVLVTSPGLGY